VFGEVLGAGVASTLRSALFDRGWVDYAVDGVRSARAQSPAGTFDRDGKRETVTREDLGSWEGSVLVRRRGSLVFPVDVELELDDGTTRRERWDGVGESTRIAWHGPAALVGAVVDPDDRVLVDSNPENNRGAVPDARRRAPRVLERVLYWAELALQTGTP
jgi:hypothetical protein